MAHRPHSCLTGNCSCQIVAPNVDRKAQYKGMEKSLAFLPSGSCTAELALVALPSSSSVPCSGFGEVKNPCRKVTIFWSIRRRNGNKATDRRNSSSLVLPGPSGLTASSSTCNEASLLTHHYYRAATLYLLGKYAGIMSATTSKLYMCLAVFVMLPTHLRV